MSTLKKIITSIRASNIDDTINNKNSNLLEKKVNNEKQNLNQAKYNLTEVMSKEMQIGREIDSLTSNINITEEQISSLLKKNEEGLALSLAEKVANLEKEKHTLISRKNSYADEIKKTKRVMESSEKLLSNYERQLAMVETTENVHKAITTITSSFNDSNSSVLSAKASLDSIRKKTFSTASNENNNQSTNKDKQSKEIETTALSVIARIRQDNK